VLGVLLLERELGHERSFAVPMLRARALCAGEFRGGVGSAALRGGQPVSPLGCPARRLDVAAVLLGSPEAFLGLALAGGGVELGGELLGVAGGQHGGQAGERVAGRLDERVFGVRGIGLFGEVEVVLGPAAGECGVGEFLAEAGVGEQEGGVGGEALGDVAGERVAVLECGPPWRVVSRRKPRSSSTWRLSMRTVSR
jgi:hypothetical protein